MTKKRKRGRHTICGPKTPVGDDGRLRRIGPIGMRIGPREERAASRNQARVILPPEKKKPLAEPKRGDSRKPVCSVLFEIPAWNSVQGPQ